MKDTLFIILVVAVPAAMILLGAQISMQEWRETIARPKSFFVGLAGQLLVLPGLAILFALFYPVAVPVKIGAVVLSAAPGGPASNLLSFVARARLSLSISLTVASSFLSVISIPLIVNLGLWINGFDTVSRLPIGPTVARSILIVAVPTLVGILLRRKYPEVVIRWQKPTRRIMFVLFIFIVCFALQQHWDILAGHTRLSVLLAVIAFGIVVVSAASLLGRVFKLTSTERLTVAIEAGIQNSLLALLIVRLLHLPEAIIFPALYALLVNFGGLAAVLIMRAAERRRVS